LCNAGFGTPSEALFLKKKLMVIPMKKQVEQFCNAEMLKEMGLAVIKKLNGDNIPKIQKWLEDDTIVEVDYPDNAEEIVNLIIENHAGDKKIDAQHESDNYNLFQ
jgi:UDP:flavonoid glycosyltransferase YjiC (YdhE family)